MKIPVNIPAMPPAANAASNASHGLRPLLIITKHIAIPRGPNTFNEIQYEDLMRKLSALDVYDKVIRTAPHPRSYENIEALVRYRGSQSGFEYAEAFECIFNLGV